MQSQGDYPICPKCQRPMVDLARYDARNEAIYLENDHDQVYYGDYDDRNPVLNKLIDWISDYMDYLTAGRKQRKLDAVLKVYPNSIYCAGCGYLVKRR